MYYLLGIIQLLGKNNYFKTIKISFRKIVSLSFIHIARTLSSHLGGCIFSQRPNPVLLRNKVLSKTINTVITVNIIYIEKSKYSLFEVWKTLCCISGSFLSLYLLKGRWTSYVSQYSWLDYTVCMLYKISSAD